MSELDRYYRGQNASWRVWQAQEAEGRARGLSQGLVEQEQLKAEWERRQADTARVQALINAGHTVWRDGGYVWEPATELPAEAQETPRTPAPAASAGPPSSGRSISPPRQS